MAGRSLRFYRHKSEMDIPASSTFPAAKQMYREVVRKLCEIDERKYHGGFTKPIDLVEYPHYKLKPICLGDIRTRLENGSYLTFDECSGDVQRVFSNALKFNASDKTVWAYVGALELQTEFQKLLLPVSALNAVRLRLAQTEQKEESKETEAPNHKRHLCQNESSQGGGKRARCCISFKWPEQEQEEKQEDLESFFRAETQLSDTESVSSVEEEESALFDRRWTKNEWNELNCVWPQVFDVVE